MEQRIKDIILDADSKAIATLSKEGEINVVPVSSVLIDQEKIWLFDYFMKKTVENIKQNPNVALVVWQDMKGWQIKGNASYVVEGDNFEKAKLWVGQNQSDRVLKGLIVISPEEFFDVGPK